MGGGMGGGAAGKKVARRRTGMLLLNAIIRLRRGSNNARSNVIATARQLSTSRRA